MSFSFFDIYIQGVYAKSTHFCIIDISVFIEIKYGYEWPYLFKILPAFRICLFFKGLTIIEGVKAVKSRFGEFCSGAL